MVLDSRFQELTDFISQKRVKLTLGVFAAILMVLSCKSVYRQQVENDRTIIETERMISILGAMDINGSMIFDKEVTIYPGAFIKTGLGGQVVFRRKVNIIGASQVFDEKADIRFGDNSIGELNVGWFGAKGDDREDDTPSFQKVLAIASGYFNSINIRIPIGQYYISNQLVIENIPGLNKTINLIGEGISNSTNQGSSLIWNGNIGGVMLLIRNNYLNVIESVDFASEEGHELLSNIELRYQIYQMEFRDCSFSGSMGGGSCNVNLNDGRSDQVSEISFRNCIFRGKTRDNIVWLTDAAIQGGKANTKNLYFEKCSFLGYRKAAIHIEVMEMLHVNNCTFSHNGTDIICLLCNTLATSNYSERSKSFFYGTNSGNLAFTTLINNYFDGEVSSDFVIPNGSGSLVLINNNFGGSGGIDTVNLIQWVPKNISTIYSIGNFFRNDSAQVSPFVFPGHGPFDFHSAGDKIGKDGTGSRPLRLLGNHDF